MGIDASHLTNDIYNKEKQLKNFYSPNEASLLELLCYIHLYPLVVLKPTSL